MPLFPAGRTDSPKAPPGKNRFLNFPSINTAPKSPPGGDFSELTAPQSFKSPQRVPAPNLRKRSSRGSGIDAGCPLGAVIQRMTFSPDFLMKHPIRYERTRRDRMNRNDHGGRFRTDIRAFPTPHPSPCLSHTPYRARGRRSCPKPRGGRPRRGRRRGVFPPSPPGC